jgi:hypothetical protein
MVGRPLKTDCVEQRLDPFIGKRGREGVALCEMVETDPPNEPI